MTPADQLSALIARYDSEGMFGIQRLVELAKECLATGNVTSEDVRSYTEIITGLLRSARSTFKYY